MRVDPEPTGAKSALSESALLGQYLDHQRETTPTVRSASSRQFRPGRPSSPTLLREPVRVSDSSRRGSSRLGRPRATP